MQSRKNHYRTTKNTDSGIQLYTSHDNDKRKDRRIMSYQNHNFTLTAASSDQGDIDSALETLAERICEFLASDNRITPLPTESTDHGVVINNKIKLIVAANSVSTSKTIFFTVRNGETDLFSFHTGCQVGSSGDSAKQFRINLHLAVCDNACCITIRNARTTGDYFTAQILLVTTTDGISAVGYNTCGNTNAMVNTSTNRNFASSAVFFDLRDNSQSLTLVHRLPYYHAATNASIATLSEKILLSGDSHIGDIPIVDSSNLVDDATYPYDGITYYAADSNTLIPVYLSQTE